MKFLLGLEVGGLMEDPEFHITNVKEVIKQMDFKRAIPCDITIKPSVNGGFLMHIGCSVAVFETKGALLVALRDYLDDPDKEVKKYNETFKNALLPPEGERTSMNEAKTGQVIWTRKE